MADGDEHAGDADVLRARCVSVERMRTPCTPAVIAEDLVDAVVPQQRHLALALALAQPVLQDFLGTQSVAPMDQRHVRGQIRQIKRLLDRGVAAADHRDALAAEEKAVTGGAGRDATAPELLFRGQPR